MDTHDFKAVEEAGQDLPAQPRGAPRDSMFLQAEIRGDRMAAPLTVRVRNLSAGGLMADCTDSFDRGEAVTANLRGLGDVPGRIAWTTADRIGIAFDREVDPRLARKTPAATPTAVRLVPATVQRSRRPGLKIL